jgi:hypothetical protein
VGTALKLDLNLGTAPTLGTSPLDGLTTLTGAPLRDTAVEDDFHGAVGGKSLA